MQTRAQGIVAMRIEQKSHVWGAHVIEFLAVGTSVRLVADRHQRLSPEMVVTLDDEVPGLAGGKAGAATAGGE